MLRVLSKLSDIFGATILQAKYMYTANSLVFASVNDNNVYWFCGQESTKDIKLHIKVLQLKNYYRSFVDLPCTQGNTST